MKVSKPLRRLLEVYLLMLIGLSVVAALLGFASNDGQLPMSAFFAPIFGLGGIVWLVVAYYSGGFVSTYRAPILEPKLSLLYALPNKDELTLPSDSPKVMADLKDKLESQTAPMVIGVLSFIGFFALSFLFFYVPYLGYSTLAGAILLLGYVLVAGTPRQRATFPKT